MRRSTLFVISLVSAAALCEPSRASPVDPPSAQPAAESPARSVVYVAHNENAITRYRSDASVVRRMVDRLLLEVTGQSTVAGAWQSLVAPKDKIGIKISAVGGELFTTHRDVVEAIVEGLVSAGHSRESIIVWDRALGGAASAGYRPGASGFQLRSISPGVGYDAKAIYTGPFLGKLIWGDLDYVGNRGETPLLSDTDNLSNQSHFCKLLTSDITKIINVPVLSDSRSAGIAGCLYNVTIPDVDNWRRFVQHPGFGATSIAEMYSDPLIKRKVVLNLMDGLIGEYAGGPESQPNYAVHHETLYASKDPVALDATALRKLETWRAEAKLPAIGSLAAHVGIAAEIGLGQAEPSHIDVRNVGP